MVEGEGFEPSKRDARQVYSLIPLATRTSLRNYLILLLKKPLYFPLNKQTIKMMVGKLAIGIEPTTAGLQNRCSAN